MAENFLLGIDIGTQGTKGLLCDLNGVVKAESYREHTIQSPRPGWAEHDAEQVWWGAFVATVQSLLSDAGIDPGQIAAVGCSAFVPAMLPIDVRGVPLRPAILYLDRRAQPQLEELGNQLRLKGVSEGEIASLALASPIPQLLWLREHEPEVFHKTAKILIPQSYIVYRLTGESVIDHGMKRTYVPLYDAAQDAWSQERAALLDLEVSILPDQIDYANSIAGLVHARAAEETGLSEGTPVTVGTADSFSEMVGAGVVFDGAAVAIYGSFTALLIAHDHLVDPHHGFHCLPGLYFSGAAAPTGASLTRWFRDTLGSDEVSQAAATGRNVYEILSAKSMAIPPGSDGLITLPFFTGEKGGLHPALKRGAIIGLTPNHTRAHLYRSILEGIAFELRSQIEDEAEAFHRMSSVGGGSNSAVWTQIMSDVLDVEQHVLEVKQGAAYGDAYLAGMAAGLFEDTAPLLERWIQVERVVTPDPATSAAYLRAYTAYRTLRNKFI